MNEVEYDRMQENAAIGQFLQSLKAETRKLNEGRNTSCWPICSFGWKDADLDPEGCTGIKDIRWQDEATVLVEVGGHKTFCYDTDDKEEREREWNYLCEAFASGRYNVSGDTEEFTASFTDEILVPVVIVDLDVDLAATATAIKESARKRCEMFEQYVAETERGCFSEKDT